jgi:hypothetical protein
VKEEYGGGGGLRRRGIILQGNGILETSLGLSQREESLS